MSNYGTEQATRSFAAALGTALEQALTSVTGTTWSFEAKGPVDSAVQQSTEAFRFAAAGDLKGEFLVRFTESQLLAILSAVVGQPVQTVGTEHLAGLEKLMNSVAERLSRALAAECGAVHFQVEQSTGQAFDGLSVVVLATVADADSQVLVYFDAPLLESLAERVGEPTQAKDADWSVDPRNLRLVMDVELNVSLRFGQRKLQLREVLDLTSGSIVELDRMVDEPVELFLGDKLIARGEAVVVDGNYGLRVTEIPQPLSSHLLN